MKAQEFFDARLSENLSNGVINYTLYLLTLHRLIHRHRCLPTFHALKRLFITQLMTYENGLSLFWATKVWSSITLLWFLIEMNDVISSLNFSRETGSVILLLFPTSELLIYCGLLYYTQKFLVRVLAYFPFDQTAQLSDFHIHFEAIVSLLSCVSTSSALSS